MYSLKLTTFSLTPPVHVARLEALSFPWMRRVEATMHSLERYPLLLALLAALAGCAPMPGQDALQRGATSSHLGNWDQSIAASTEALGVAVDPEVVFLSYSSRCEFRIWKGEFAGAMEDCNDAIRAKQGYYGYPHAARGRLFAIRGLHDWAIEELNIAITLGGSKRIAGRNNPKVIAYAAKARIFATSTDPEFRNTDLAVRFAEKAVGMESNIETPAYKILHRDTLAAAYAEAGRFVEAVAEQKKTIAMASANSWGGATYKGEALLEILNRHLGEFERNKPLRDGIF
jgi:tetratricopeptide (TPR) repeat protein